jgi:hypothetical protein
MNRPRVSPAGQAVRLAIGLCFMLALTMKASAQGTPWLSDRLYKEGPGIKVGELELHPGIAIRGGYDNNVFRSDGKTNGGLSLPKKDAPILAISPHLYLSTQTAQRAKEGEDRGPQQPSFMSFRLGAAAHYLHYFLENAPHNVGAEAEFFLGIAQNRVVGVDFSAEYVRSVPPFTQDAHDRNAYINDMVQPRMRLNFRSHSQVLTGYLGYAPRYTHYKSSTFDYLNNIQQRAEAGTAWRFLPSTALVYDATFAYQDFTNYNVNDQALILLSTNKIFRTRLGINGALTNKLLLRVLAGYAVGFFNNKELDDFESAIGEAVLTYRFDPHSFEVGYERDVQPSAVGSWYQTDRGFAKANFLFARKFALGFEAGVAHANFGRLIRIVNGMPIGLGTLNENGENDETRQDIRVDGAVRSVITDFDFAVSAAGGQQIPDPADYTYYQIFGGVRAHY